jgi:hypothetical protein
MIETDDGETLPEAEAEKITAEAETAETEEEIPQEERPAKKKVAMLKARHQLEDYFEMKKLKEALDYLFEDEEGESKK